MSFGMLDLRPHYSSACFIIIIIIIIILNLWSHVLIDKCEVLSTFIPMGSRFSARPDRPWGPPSLL